MKYQNRNEIPDSYKWDIELIFPSADAFLKELKDVDVAKDILVEFKGKLNDKATIKKALDNLYSINKRLDRLYFYAARRFDVDITNSESQNLRSQIHTLGSNIETMISYMIPELTKLSDEKIKELIADKDLQDYSEYFKELLRQKAHTLSNDEEMLLSMFGSNAGSFSSIFDMIDNADMKFGTIKDENGNDIKVTHAQYSQCLSSADRRVRKDAFNSYYKMYRDTLNTISTNFAASVKQDWIFAKAKKFTSCLEQAMYNENIPTCVYTNLIESIGNNTKLMHEYMALRKEVMGLDELHMYDMHTSIVNGVEKHYEIEEAFELVKEGLKPLGENYVALLDEAMKNRWVDVYETPGKTNGAYSSGICDIHPYVLLNYDHTLVGISYIAHELGHAMHSYLSTHTQVYPKAYYPIFLAEIASTTNEVLLIKYLLSKTDDKEMKKYLLSHYIDKFRSSAFRQSMFAEFEEIAHSMEEKGEPL
ncbi:MAG: M3 family oligoendopeptidase, partial [Oscillospiraceae bacterium]